MRRFLWCLGVFGLMAGASLVLPGVASAQPGCPQISDPNNPNHFAIYETPAFQPDPLLQMYVCALVDIPTGVVVFDMTEPTGVVSDNVQLTVGQSGGPALVILNSDSEAGLSPTSGANTVSELPVTCPPGFGPEPGEGRCDGADLPITLLPDPPTSAATVQGVLTVYSDLAPIPEPSTGLLLGAALPALFGIRRRFS